ncbi:MAG: thiamine pyrophosphate-binding protein, partial [Hyphomicrobiaceae bacterium]
MTDWRDDIHKIFTENDIQQVSYVPDAGHARVIDLCREDNRMNAVPMTTEMEGIGLACGAWLGGQKAVILMQSSGVGNCINALSLPAVCQFPLLMLVAMRTSSAKDSAGRCRWATPCGRRSRRWASSATTSSMRPMSAPCSR